MDEEIIHDLKWLLQQVEDGKYGRGDSFDLEYFGEDLEKVSGDWFDE